ncbi:MAG: virulence RhuM family protein, partial [Chlorobium sp.]|nr:virulence RhuM family protein [Chlorobium sp.]
ASSPVRPYRLDSHQKLTTASDGKEYNVTFYSLEMILAIGFRVRSKRGTQFSIWANRSLS